MKLKASKELEALHLQILADDKLTAQDVRVMFAWLVDNQDFSAGPQKLMERLPNLNLRECRRSLKNLVNQGYLVEELKEVELKYGGHQTICFYILKSTKAGGKQAGGLMSPTNLPKEPRTNLSSNLASERGETETFIEQEDPEYWKQMVKDAEERYRGLL